MSGEGEYYIPEIIEDENLRNVAPLVIEILKENVILESIIQKYIAAYNTLENNGSSNSLEIMNQNHKQVFSTITSSGVIKSPRISSVIAKKDAAITCSVNPQISTPLKIINQARLSKERKRLSFDVAENEHQKHVKASTEVFDEGQMCMNTNSSFLKQTDEAIPVGNAQAIPANITEAVPEWFYNTFSDQIAQALNSSNKDETSMNRNTEEKRDAWYLQSRPSLYNIEKALKASDSPDKYIQQRCNIEGKPETVTSLYMYNLEDAYVKKETRDDHQAVDKSPENQNNTLKNYESSARCSPFGSQFASSEKKVNVSDKHETNEQETFNPDESVSPLSVDHLKTLSISYKTPEKFQTVTTKFNKEDRAPRNQTVLKKVTSIARNYKESSSSIKDVKTSNQNMKKRKSSDDSEEDKMITSLVADDEDFMVPSKISKLNHDLTTNDKEVIIAADVSVRNGNDSFCSDNDSPMDANNDFHSVDNFSMDDDGHGKISKLNTEVLTSVEKDISAGISVMNGNDSSCSIDESLMDANKPLHSVDNYTMDCNNSFNLPDGDYVVDQEIIRFKDKSIISAIHINNNCKSMSVTPDKKPENSIYQSSITHDCVSPFLTKAINVGECPSPVKDVIKPNNSNMEMQKSSLYSEKATMATSLVPENQKVMISSKISKLNNELTANDEKVTVSADRSVITGNICSIDESPIDAKNPFQSAKDCHDSFNRPDCDFIIDQDIAKSDNESMSVVDSINNCEKMFVTPDKKSESSKNCVSHFLPEADRKKMAAEAKSDIGKFKYDKVKTGENETNDVKYLTNLMENLSPLEKRSSSDDTFTKSLTRVSAVENATSSEKLRLQDNVSKTPPPHRECSIYNQLSSKANNSNAIHAAKFLEYLELKLARFSNYRHIFIEDHNDLTYMCEHIVKLARVLLFQFSDNQLYLNNVSDFTERGVGLYKKGNSWISKIVEDLKSLEDCIKKINEIQQNLKSFRSETKPDATPKDLKKWEASFSRVNKIADDIILLREVRRPTIIQFGHEVENLIQMFIQCMFVVGLLKHSSKISSDCE